MLMFKPDQVNVLLCNANGFNKSNGCCYGAEKDFRYLTHNPCVSVCCPLILCWIKCPIDLILCAQIRKTIKNIYLISLVAILSRSHVRYKIQLKSSYFICYYICFCVQIRIATYSLNEMILFRINIHSVLASVCFSVPQCVCPHWNALSNSQQHWLHCIPYLVRQIRVLKRTECARNRVHFANKTSSDGRMRTKPATLQLEIRDACPLRGPWSTCYLHATSAVSRGETLCRERIRICSLCVCSVCYPIECTHGHGAVAVRPATCTP